MTLAETIQTGMNNPECAFFVGQFFGQTISIKLLFAILIIYSVMKLLDKALLFPIAAWIKKKVWKK